MKNTTMLEVASQFVLNNSEQNFTFNEIFEIVEQELKENWINKFLINNSEISYEEIRERKMGELYRLLTVDKNFLRNDDGTWCSKHKIY